MNLLLGDCLELIPTLSDKSFDLVVTSPPYNLGINYSKYEDKQESHTFIAWCLAWATELKRVMADDASFFLNFSGSPSSPLVPFQLILALSSGPDPLFVLQNTFHWIKSISVKSPEAHKEISVGHFKPINSKRFVNDCHEFIFHLTKTGEVPLDKKAVGVPYKYKSNIARWGHTDGADLRCRGNNWHIPYDTIQSRSGERPHPATFPIALVERCIDIHGKGPDTCLLDPFLGIGSSALAAKSRKLEHFTGIEIDPEYMKEASRRIVSAEESRPFL